MVHKSKQSPIRNRRQNRFNNGDQMKIIKMRYSIEPRDFYLLAKTWVKV